MALGGQPHAPAALPPRKGPGTHCIGGWVGPRAGVDRCGKSRPQRDSISGPSSPQRIEVLGWETMWKTACSKTACSRPGRNCQFIKVDL
jgi:hypothetical protein